MIYNLQLYIISGYKQTLYENNMQLTELKLYINKIARCLGIVVILSARIQDHQFKLFIKCSTLLQVYYIQINQQASVVHINLQAQPNIYFSSRLQPQTHDLNLQPPLKPQHLLLLL